MFDLTSSHGQAEYLRAVPVVRITKSALEGNYFRHRLDGMRHNWIPAKETNHCQFCYYQLMNDYDENERCYLTSELKQNRSSIQQCLVCHVNLCPQCDNCFHGADLSSYSKALPL